MTVALLALGVTIGSKPVVDYSSSASCRRLQKPEKQAIATPFEQPKVDEVASELQNWFTCTEPVDDVDMTCFLAPDWMVEEGIGDDKYVCSDTPALAAAFLGDNGALSPDDSY